MIVIRVVFDGAFVLLYTWRSFRSLLLAFSFFRGAGPKFKMNTLKNHHPFVFSLSPTQGGEC